MNDYIIPRQERPQTDAEYQITTLEDNGKQAMEEVMYRWTKSCLRHYLDKLTATGYYFYRIHQPRSQETAIGGHVDNAKTKTETVARICVWRKRG